MKVQLKPAFKRPWLHHLIFISYIAAPFANVLLLTLFLHVSLGRVLANLVAGYGLLGALWLFSAPIVGVSLYFAQRFSWYVFLGHSGLILLDFVVKWATRPAYYLRTVPGFHNILLLAGNVALVAIVAYIIQRDFRAPYFQVLNRSWRERERFPIYHVVALDGQSRIMDDLSAGGCFVLEPGSTRTPGAKVAVSFKSAMLTIDCTGQIMRLTEKGLGIRFLRLPLGKKREISRLLRERFSLRHKVDIPCTWVFEDEESESRMADLSPGGCYLQAQFAGLSEGSVGKLKAILPCNSHSYDLQGRVVWINRTGEHGKPLGFGFQFAHRQSGFLKDVTRNYGQGMLVR